MQTTNSASKEGAAAIVLAAGKGTRMRSDLPKVLHRLHGTPLVLHPIGAATDAGATHVVVVVGHGGEQVRQTVSASVSDGVELRFAEQQQQLGTGHAVLCALEQLRDAQGPAWVLSGDVPLLRAKTLARLADAWRTSSAKLALAIFRPEDNQGYGRILRDEGGRIVGIREQRDASPSELDIEECNAGVYCIDLDLLRRELPLLGAANDQGEIYLTDLVARAARDGAVAGVEIEAIEAAGVNTVEQLEALERHVDQN